MPSFFRFAIQTPQGACHIKGYESPESRGETEHAWRSPEGDESKPTLLMRMIYDLNRQKASVPRNDRVKFQFEQWGGIGSVHLNVYAGPVDRPMLLPEASATIGDYRLGDARRIVFVLEKGLPQPNVPEPISGMALHWDPPEDPNQSNSRFKNLMAVWYSAPEHSGTLTLVESSAAEFFP